MTLAVAACQSTTDPTIAPSPAGSPPAVSPTPTPATACGEIEEPALQDGGHLIGDQQPPVPYSSTPGSSGWHTSGPPPTGVHAEPLTDPQIVSVLHGGGVVAAYDPARLDQDQIRSLEDLGHRDDRLTVAPYDGQLPTPLALVSWGRLQRCDRVAAPAIASFADRTAGSADGHG